MKHTKPFMGKQALSFEDKVVFTRAILCLCVCVCVCVSGSVGLYMGVKGMSVVYRCV